MGGYRFNPFTGTLDRVGATATGGGQVWQANKSPVEQPNGTRTIFTVPDSYITTSLRVELNGQALAPGMERDFTETSAATFTFNVPPLTNDVIILMYRTG